MISKNIPVALVLNAILAGALIGPAEAAEHPECFTTTESVSVAGVSYRVETISDIGSCTWTVPASIKSVDIRLVAAGGGGGGGDSTLNGRSGGGGGAGGVVEDVLDVPVASGATIVFTVGSGGAGGTGSLADGTPATNGSVGGNSSFAVSSPALFRFTSGGQGGTAASAGEGGAGVAGDGGDYGNVLSGAEGVLRQGGSGGSSLSTGSLSSQKNIGRSFSGFSSSPLALSSGGGGGNVAEFGVSGSEPGSGGGGGRGSQNLTQENFGFDGRAGVAGLVMVRYQAPPPVSQPSPPPAKETPLELTVDRSAVSGASGKASGGDLGAIFAIKIDGQKVGFEIVGPSVVFSVPDLPPGNYSLEFLTSDTRIGLATNIQITESKSQAGRRVNAGSFKGFVAIYARGYEGQRLSAKVGNDWVIVPEIKNNQENGKLFRLVEFTGAGYTINVPIYINRVLVETVTVTTR